MPSLYWLRITYCCNRNIKKGFCVYAYHHSVSSIRKPEIMSSQCEECGEQYIGDIFYKWCKPCQINYLFSLPKKNLGSGNEEIDNLIREM